MKQFATIFILSCATAVSAVALSAHGGIRARAGIRAAGGAQQVSLSAASTAQIAGSAELRPKFIAGQVLRYKMELVTTTEGSSGGVVQDPQGPSKLIVTWDAIVRIEVLPPDIAPPKDTASAGATTFAQGADSPAALRLRMTYEQSAATIQSDGYDPSSHSIQDQYQRLQGHAVEFALDASGRVTNISGGDDVFATPQAARDAQAWVAQISSGVGTPGSTVALGQQWSSDEPAVGIPLPDMIWHTDSNYLRNEACAPDAPAHVGTPSDSPAPAAGVLPAPSTSPDSGLSAQSTAAYVPAETCAVIDTRVSLVPSKATQKAENNAVKNNAMQNNSNAASPTNVPKGLHTSGSWTGASESLIYVSLRTGWVVSIAQNGDEKMDVTVVSDHLDSMRYAGTVHSHVDLLLLPH